MVNIDPNADDFERENVNEKNISDFIDNGFYNVLCGCSGG